MMKTNKSTALPKNKTISGVAVESQVFTQGSLKTSRHKKSTTTDSSIGSKDYKTTRKPKDQSALSGSGETGGFFDSYLLGYMTLS